MIINMNWNNGLVFGIMSESIFAIHEGSEDKDEYTEDDVTETSCISIYLGIFHVDIIFE